MNLTPEEKSQVIGVAQELLAIEQSPAWKHFVKAAEAFALSNTPRVQMIKGQEHAIEVASQLAFANGVRACIGLVDQQRAVLKSLTK